MGPKVMAYELEFIDALERCFNGEFIRGENFAPGMYAKMMPNGVVVLVDGNRMHRITENMLLYRDMFRQKYRAFSTANNAILDLAEAK